jgi:hypothetical protein
MDYTKLKINELKSELKTRGLGIVGNKSELIERLKEYDEKNQESDSNSDNGSNESDESNESNKPKLLELNFETLMGKHLTLNLEDTTTFLEMKTPLSEKLGLPASKIALHLRTRSPTYLPKAGDLKYHDGSIGIYISNKMLNKKLSEMDEITNWFFDISIRF